MKFNLFKKDWIFIICILILSSLVVLSFKLSWSSWASASILFLLFISSFFKKNKIFGNWLFTVLIGFYFVLILILSLFNSKLIDVNFLALSLIISIGLLFLLALVTIAKDFFQSKTLLSLIISYSLLVIMLIVLFAGVYAFFNDLTYQGEALEQDNYSTFNYIYFSANTFYSMNYGYFATMKNSRIVSVVELYSSYLIHVLIIAWWFSKNHPREK